MQYEGTSSRELSTNSNSLNSSDKLQGSSPAKRKWAFLTKELYPWDFLQGNLFVCANLYCSRKRLGATSRLSKVPKKNSRVTRGISSMQERGNSFETVAALLQAKNS